MIRRTIQSSTKLLIHEGTRTYLCNRLTDTLWFLNRGPSGEGLTRDRKSRQTVSSIKDKTIGAFVNYLIKSEIANFLVQYGTRVVHYKDVWQMYDPTSVPYGISWSSVHTGWPPGSIPYGTGQLCTPKTESMSVSFTKPGGHEHLTAIESKRIGFYVSS